MDTIRHIVVIGGAGKMGRLFVNRSRDAGYTVDAFDKPLDETVLAAALPSADCVVLAVPADAMSGVADMVSASMREDAILTDVCSVKVRPMEYMMIAHSGPVIGTHPLFGPNPDPEDLRVAVTPGRDDVDGTAERRVLAWLSTIGFDPFVTSAERHDKAAAFFQGLNFISTVAYLATQAQDPDIREFMTPSFQRRLRAAKKLILEDAALFTMLFESNPFSQDAVRTYRNYLNVAAGGDVDLLIERAAAWWREERKAKELK
ncbi:prephenate dehydrogenase/arogenate dehydrogenase family protein [Desulfovibrio inopinatus]|uniref:prephenate dehydrogenase/arogenate dehydrogenase family protein n=1 Tax=Desulfovibrio inopinatus TaxID=102109 RepID=UPI00040D7056|nr:prephenate dehydrogenase/arogenate dehydrogenase family protein [Desulfovibrio inopinatus]